MSMSGPCIMRYMCVLITVILLGVNGSGRAGDPPQSLTNELAAAGFDDPKALEEFLTTLKEAAARDDAKRLAEMVKYPLTVVSRRGKRLIRTRTDFIKSYRRVFIPAGMSRSLLNRGGSSAAVL